jgi:hypothetical protein
MCHPATPPGSFLLSHRVHGSRCAHHHTHLARLRIDNRGSKREAGEGRIGIQTQPACQLPPKGARMQGKGVVRRRSKGFVAADVVHESVHVQPAGVYLQAAEKIQSWECDHTRSGPLDVCHVMPMCSAKSTTTISRKKTPPSAKFHVAPEHPCMLWYMHLLCSHMETCNTAIARLSSQNASVHPLYMHVTPMYM